MVVRYGRACEEGFLPVFSVGSEKEAHMLITLCCPKDVNGDYIARELVQGQTLENLDSFSDLLAERHKMAAERGWCDCKEL